jgi:hypothetical protein
VCDVEAQPPRRGGLQNPFQNEAWCRRSETSS